MHDAQVTLVGGAQQLSDLGLVQVRRGGQEVGYLSRLLRQQPCLLQELDALLRLCVEQRNALPEQHLVRLGLLKPLSLRQRVGGAVALALALRSRGCQRVLSHRLLGGNGSLGGGSCSRACARLRRGVFVDPLGQRQGHVRQRAGGGHAHGSLLGGQDEAGGDVCGAALPHDAQQRGGDPLKQVGVVQVAVVVDEQVHHQLRVAALVSQAAQHRDPLPVWHRRRVSHGRQRRVGGAAVLAGRLCGLQRLQEDDFREDAYLSLEVGPEALQEADVDAARQVEQVQGAGAAVLEQRPAQELADGVGKLGAAPEHGACIGQQDLEQLQAQHLAAVCERVRHRRGGAALRGSLHAELAEGAEHQEGVTTQRRAGGIHPLLLVAASSARVG